MIKEEVSPVFKLPTPNLPFPPSYLCYILMELTKNGKEPRKFISKWSRFKPGIILEGIEEAKSNFQPEAIYEPVWGVIKFGSNEGKSFPPWRGLRHQIFPSKIENEGATLYLAMRM